MIYELEKKDYEKVRPLFKGWKNTAVNSALDGHTFGRIYVDNPKTPETALAWGSPIMFFLAGDCTNEKFNSSLNKFISEKIAPEASKRGLTYFAVQCYPVKKWESTIRTILKERHFNVNYEWKSVFNKKKFTNQQVHLPPGFSIAKVDKKVLKKVDSKRDVKRIKKFWGSIDTFLKKGVGFYLIKDNEVISSCISCYVSGTEYEISIVTHDPEERKKGFATAVARAYIDYCVQHGLTPVWTADMVNPASIAVAEKLGFEKVGEYPDYYFYFDELENIVFNVCNNVRQRNFKKVEIFLEKSAEIGGLTPVHYYRIGRAYASAGEDDTAFKYIKKAIDNGFTDVKRLTEDENLKRLQKTEKWEKLLSIM